MDTFKIRAILTAVKHKSLSKAAEDYSYTPSAFSHLASSFEDELGIILLKRSSSGVELTSEGKALLPLFEAIIRDEETLKKTISLLSENKKKELRIASYSSLSRHLLPDILKELKKKYPDIKPSIYVNDDLNGWLEEDKADIIFADEKTFGNTKWFALSEDKYYAVLPSGILSAKKSVGLEELYPYTFIDCDDEYLNFNSAVKLFSERIYFKSEDDLSVINMVREGIGIAILPELVLKENLLDVNALPIEPILSRTLGFAYHQKRISELGLTHFFKKLPKTKMQD